MTETITAQEVLKSRQNFSNYIEKHKDKVIEELLKDYPNRGLHIICPQLTQNADGLIEAVGGLRGNQKAYIFWFIANEKEDLINIAKTLNHCFNQNYCGLFVIKTILNGDKIEFKPILKPEIPTKQVRNNNTPAKQIQKDANIARCTVSSWKIRGIPRAWVKFFQERYPELKVWQEIKA